MADIQKIIVSNMAETNNAEISFEKNMWTVADLLRGNLNVFEYNL